MYGFTGTPSQVTPLWDKIRADDMVGVKDGALGLGPKRIRPEVMLEVVLYPRRTATNSLSFLERLIEEMPFPTQAIQTDRGREFFAYCFQEKLMEYGIKFRPIRPASPHLNGKG